MSSTQSDFCELTDSAIIKENILSSKFKITAKRGRSKVWDVYGMIENNGVEIEKKVACRNCFSVMKYDERSTSNLVKHKCYVAIKEANVSKIPVNMEIKKEAEKLISKWCIENCRPFHFVEDNGLKQYSEFLVSVGARYGTNVDVKSLLPHPTTISRNIEKKYETVFVNVKNEIVSHCKNGYGLTPDIWTDNYLRKSYISLTIHYIKNGQLFSRLLGLNSMDGARSTSDIIQSKIENLLGKYNCKLEEAVMVTDRGSNIMAAFNTYPRINCINHLINNVIEKAIKQVEEVSELCNLCSKLVKYFKKCGENCNLSNSLKSLCPTRWNTLYYLFESVETNWMDISNILQRKNELQRIEKINISYVKGIVNILKPFEQASKTLEGEKYATLHLAYAYISGLMDNCKPENDEIEVMRRFKEILFHHLNTTVFSKLTTLHKIAHFLFPPTNKLLQFSEQDKNLIKSECMEELKRYWCNEDNKPNKESSSTNNTIISSYFKNFVTPASNFSAEDKVTEEIQMYQNLNIPFKDNFDVINWWHLQQTQFPILYRLSCKILATPASSAASERVLAVA